MCASEIRATTEPDEQNLVTFRWNNGPHRPETCGKRTEYCEIKWEDVVAATENKRTNPRIGHVWSAHTEGRGKANYPLGGQTDSEESKIEMGRVRKMT